ncbi:hypothetical protein Tco_0467853 [Tanacetum coccineum]
MLKCNLNGFAKPEFLKKAQRANPRLYDIGCYNDNLALMLAPDSDETIRLEKERRSKLSDLIRPFDYDQLNNLYDLGNVADLRYFILLKNEVDTLKSQLETQETQFLNEIDRLSREYYYADHMNAILGVYTDLDEVTNLHAMCSYLEPGKILDAQLQDNGIAISGLEDHIEDERKIYTVMSDSEDSTVTYTAVSSPFGGLSDIGSPGVVGPEHEGLPWMLDDPYVQATPEEDPADYPADGGDDGDDEDEPSDDDEDEEVDIKADDEEVEHPTPADSTAVALPAIDQALSAEETEPFKTDEFAATPPPHHMNTALQLDFYSQLRVPTPVLVDAEP